MFVINLLLYISRKYKSNFQTYNKMSVQIGFTIIFIIII